MDDPLGSDVHIRSGGHLSVLGNAEGIKFLPVVRLTVVGNHHPVGYHNTRRFFAGREKSHRMSAVHVQGLLHGHLAEVLHREQVLCPILKNGTVPAVSDELFRVLCHRWIQVVLDHQHDGGSLRTLRRIFANIAGFHLVIGLKTVHVNASVDFELFQEFWRQFSMPLLREIAQRVF